MITYILTFGAIFWDYPVKPVLEQLTVNNLDKQTVSGCGHVQVCASLQTDNHANTPPLSFLQAGCPACRPTNSIKALKAR